MWTVQYGSYAEMLMNAYVTPTYYSVSFSIKTSRDKTNLNLFATKIWLSISQLNGDRSLCMGAVPHKAKSFITLHPNFFNWSHTKCMEVAVEVNLAYLAK